MSFADIVLGIEREWQSRYGHLRYWPQKTDDGTYTKGIGHTGGTWPQGSGHDWCWEPNHCISCDCSWQGPCTVHENMATILGWDGTRSTARVTSA